MAHHGHFENNIETQALRSMQSRPPSLSLPSISEDELAAEADEPPDETSRTFTKTLPANRSRAASLLTKGLIVENESHDEDFSHIRDISHAMSRSSTCSTVSAHSSNGVSWNGFGSDGGFTSSGTRASTPSSPPPTASLLHMKPTVHQSPPSSIPQASNNTTPSNRTPKPASPTLQASTTSAEPVVEATLGRKRCISFACGRKETLPAEKPVPEVKIQEAPPAPAKKTCMLKFACPMSKTSVDKPNKDRAPQMSRHLSPAPAALRAKAPTIKVQDRPHRDSDSTLNGSSPRATRKPQPIHIRHLSNDSTIDKGEALRFHEFGTSEEEVDDWVQESTCHRSRLTVKDTLKKENVIRETCQEAEEEMDEEVDVDDELEDDDDDDDAVSDEGFQTDDEEGFAESDEESENDSDYEWWTYRHSPRPTSLVPSVDSRRRIRRSSVTSVNSSSSEQSPTRSPTAIRNKARRAARASDPVIIRPGTPELPDSTDFVCGTLDEDRPLEQAYLSCLAQRKASKQIITPQDIDPTFPTSDPDIESDEDSDVPDSVRESDNHMFLHGRLDNIDGNQLRGRRPIKEVRPAPVTSPKRIRSPAPLSKRPTFAQSPAPRALFGHSPVRDWSPAPLQRVHSPPPSLIRSAHNSPSSNTVRPRHTFLGQRPQLTHTASLPRSPCPFTRRVRKMHNEANQIATLSGEDDEATANEATYNRGAMDIVQGLECKRLRRRQKFYERYCRKEEKKHTKKEKRPPPGKGAQRMRQIGIECAQYRGKRVLSV